MQIVYCAPPPGRLAPQTRGNSGYATVIYLPTTSLAAVTSDLFPQGYLDGTRHDTATCSAIAELTTDDSVRVTGETADPAGMRAADSGFLGHIIESGAASLRK